MRFGPVVVVLAALVCCAGALASLAWQGNQPYKSGETPTTLVVIEPGQPAGAAATRLKETGLIRNALAFRLLMRVRRAESRIHAGEYEFTGPRTPNEILEKLMRGDVVQHRITIPEGLRLDEIAAAVEASGFSTKQKFIEASTGERGVRLIRDLDPAAEDLEGYLFPDTYLFARGTTAERIVAEMVNRFRSEMTPARLARMKELGFTIRQTLTMASLVEEEAACAEERPRISGVFHNRLRLRMLLQCDPTVVYALTRAHRYRGEIHRSDLSYSSPYNTYVNAGLPPGPICSPGSLSLDAALHPAVTTDLYFVVSEPGRHRFSTTLEDHQRAVRRYRRDLVLRSGRR